MGKPGTIFQESQSISQVYLNFFERGDRGFGVFQLSPDFYCFLLCEKGRNGQWHEQHREVRRDSYTHAYMYRGSTRVILD